MKTQSVILSKQILVVAALALGLAAANVTNGVIIVKPTSVVVNAFDFEGGAMVGDHMIDNSGLSAALATGDPVPGTYPTHSDAPSFATMWRTSDRPATATFALGGLDSLVGFHYWNYSQEGIGQDRGTKDVDISVSTNGGGTYAFLGSFTLAMAPGGSYSGADIVFSSTTLADHVKFDIVTNYGSGGATTGPVGLGEIRFLAEVVVPEPASLSLLAVGGLLLLWRQREKME